MSVISLIYLVYLYPIYPTKGSFVPCKVDAHTDTEYIVEKMIQDPAEYRV